MIYSSSKVKTITLEDILNRLSEYDIYAYYLGANFKIGKPISSPFRRDANPSFGIFKSDNGALLWKDLGTGDTGNCVSFVRDILTYPKTKYGSLMAMEKIYEDIIQRNGINGFYNTPKVTLSLSCVQHDSKATLNVKRKEWTETDINYWRSYHIPLKTLEKFAVSPIQYVFLNDIIVWMYTPENPMYVYKIYNGLKVYRPFAEKAKKWLSSCKRFDLQGLQQLPQNNKLLIITKSLKDVMVLHELGYNAVAPHAEHHAIPKNIITHLKNRFNRVVVLYDNDRVGIEGAKKLGKRYNLNLIFIPKEEGVKDISDFVKKYTLTEGKKLLTKLLNG